MAKIDAVHRFSLEDMPGAPEELEPLLTQQGNVNEAVINALRGSLTHAENTTSGYFVDNFTHGVEKIIKNPLKVSPKGAESVLVEKLSTDAPNASRQRVRSVDLRYINGKDDPKAPEQLGVTVYYDIDHSDEFLEISKTADQSTLNGASTTVTWGTETQRIGAGITQSAGVFTVASAGVYNVTYQSNIVGGTFTALEVWIESASTRYGHQNAYDATGALNCVVWPLTLAAGGTFSCLAFQTNGAAAARTIDGTTINRCRVAVQRARNTTAPKARVTLFLHGG